jgi:hypothetical protein
MFLGPHLRTPNPEFNPGFTPAFVIYKGGEPRVKPRVWRPEMWAQPIQCAGIIVRTRVIIRTIIKVIPDLAIEILDR